MTEDLYSDFHGTTAALMMMTSTTTTTTEKSSIYPSAHSQLMIPVSECVSYSLSLSLFLFGVLELDSLASKS